MVGLYNHCTVNFISTFEFKNDYGLAGFLNRISDLHVFFVLL